MTIDELIERQCDNMATGTQMKQFLRDESGEEPELRELLRLNLEQFYCSISSEFQAGLEQAQITADTLGTTLMAVRELVRPRTGKGADQVTIPNVLPNDDGIRPAGNCDECFYCRQKIGSPHREYCVAIYKKVKVKMTIEYEIEVPYSWTAEDIEFHRNEGSWCSNNLLEELERVAEERGCLCGIAEFKYVDVTVPGPYGATRRTE